MIIDNIKAIINQDVSIEVIDKNGHGTIILAENASQVGRVRFFCAAKKRNPTFTFYSMIKFFVSD